ncbi:hypothetical protein PsorP6_006780 [Peronosclerospora sorghi]|uniref:Uncharacterized protein n=1 Tax=Peronosclerospora sorghi TaxID=230839 RepID=A0ACC0W4K9_9STRA|nr:hypothetical protein PsorP6_006780 [Peronosclerospora sorghi]
MSLSTILWTTKCPLAIITMNWVNSSLELAGSLLESVDQHAALTLAGNEVEEEEQNIESTTTLQVRKSFVGDMPCVADYYDKEEISAEDVPVSTIALSSSSCSSQTPSNEKSHTNTTFSHSKSSIIPVGFANAISVKVDNASSGRGEKAPSSNSSKQSVSTEKNCTLLQKEIERLKTELRVKEKQLSSTQRSLQICEKELVALEQESKEKIAQVHHKLSIFQQSKNTDEQNFIHTLEMKDNQIRAMQTDINALTETKLEYANEIAVLKAKLAKAVESKDTLWDSAALASNESNQLIQSLRSELHDTLAVMKNLKRDYAESKKAMYLRQSQLESTNAELVNNVAKLEYELAKAKESVSVVSQTSSTDEITGSSSAHYGAKPNFASINEEYRQVQQSLVIMKKSLHDESKKNVLLKQEINALTDEVSRLRQTLGTEQEDSLRQIEAMAGENEKLREQVKQLTSYAAAGSDKLCVQRLTNRLIEKQETIDSLRSRVTAISVRLQDAQLRTQRTEEKLAQLEQTGSIDDIELATPMEKITRRGIRSRVNRMAHMISSVAPVVQRSHRVITVLDIFDRLLLFLGRVFLRVPLARLGILCYVVLIHVWVFIVLSFHTKHLAD